MAKRYLAAVQAAVCLTFLCSTAPSQIPRGHVVMSSFSLSGGPNDGLSTCRSFGPTVITPIAPLPVGITGSGLSTPAGAGSVLVDPNSGDIVVGEHAQAGSSLDVHMVALSGTTVTGVVSYPLGTVAAGSVGSTDQMAWLGSDILVLNRRAALVAGPLAGHSLGIVRPSVGPPGTPGSVVALPLTILLAGTVNAMALDAAGMAAYVATFVFSGGTATSTIHRIPVLPPHTPQVVATVPDAVLSLAFDADGLLMAGTGFSAAGGNFLHAVNVATGAIVASLGATWPTTPFTLRHANGLACDHSTGDLLFVEDLLRVVFRVKRLGFAAYGLPQQIATRLVDTPSGIAIRPAVTTYGQGTPGAFSYAWQTTLLPGGPAALGNSTFQLAMTPTASTALTVLAVSAGSPTPAPSPTPLGVTLLLDPATAFAPLVFAQPPVAIPLGLPAAAALAGQHFFFQTVHLEPAGFAASDGLWLTPF
ncbi:MAG: hypothetical protein WAT39_04525 [Planctomycetota bacterium]